MQILNQKVADRFARKHADAANWLENWTSVVRAANWQTIHEVRTAFPAADGGVPVASGGTVTIFDVCGNTYRMITTIAYPAQVLTILELMTHAEYSRNRWKERY
jgi:mRNA interferase HigB